MIFTKFRFVAHLSMFGPLPFLLNIHSFGHSLVWSLLIRVLMLFKRLYTDLPRSFVCTCIRNFLLSTTDSIYRSFMYYDSPRSYAPPLSPRFGFIYLEDVYHQQLRYSAMQGKSLCNPRQAITIHVLLSE